MRTHFLALVTLIALAACTSKPILPDAKNVKVSRDDANSKCVMLGKVVGSVRSSRGTLEQALEDMKQDAAKKGANFVKIDATGAMGTSVQGTAYDCP